MRRLAIVLWSVASVGVGANVWLGVTPHAEPVTAAIDRDEVPVVCESAPPDRGVPIDGCSRQLSECSSLAESCTALLDDCRYEGDRHRANDERFAGGVRDLAREARFAPLVGHALDDLEGVEWSLECRAEICAVEMIGDVEAAMAAVQAAANPVTMSASFTATEDLGDRGKKLTAYFETHPPERVFAMPLLIEAQNRFEESRALESCPARYGDAGTFNVRIDLDREAGFIVQPGGSLGTTKTGACLRDALRKVLDDIAIPPQHTGATRILVYDVPSS